MKNSKLCLLLFVLISLAISCKKESNNINETHESESIAKAVSYVDFLKSINTIDKLILKVKIKNPEESFTASSSFSEELFSIDSSTITMLSTNYNSSVYSMILKPKNYFAGNCFFNLFVKIDSLGVVTQSIFKFTPTEGTRNNGKKNFVGNYQILQNNQVKNFVNTNSICEYLQISIPCANGYIHSNNGPGPWCDAQGSQQYSSIVCSSPTNTYIGGDIGSGGGGGGGGYNPSDGNGMITVPDEIVVFGPCAGNSAGNQFIAILYNNNLVWANQHSYEFNQLTAFLCGNPSLQTQNFVAWAIEYLIQNPSVNFTLFQNQYMTPVEGLDEPFEEAYWNNPNNSFPHQNLPTLANFKAFFPKRNDPLYNTSSKLHISIGGNLLAHLGSGDGINTCAVRVSKALNYSGVIVPNIPGQTFKGADNFYYFTGAANINAWMRKTFGCFNPNTNIGEYSNSSSIHYSQSDITSYGGNLSFIFNGLEGLFSMVSSNPSWATGHADILLNNNDKMCDGGCHFDGPILFLDFWLLP